MGYLILFDASVFGGAVAFGFEFGPHFFEQIFFVVVIRVEVGGVGFYFVFDLIQN